jgi:phosphohistidine phosphatase
MTIRVYLLRHGPAGLRSAWKGPDAERPLTKNGRRKMKGIAAALAGEGMEPDLILTSPYARAEQTATLVAKALDRTDAVVVEEALAPGFTPGAFITLLEQHTDAATIMLVGHDPDLSTLTTKLSGARIVLQKGALVELELDRPTEAVLVRLSQPVHMLGTETLRPRRSRRRAAR